MKSLLRYFLLSLFLLLVNVAYGQDDKANIGGGMFIGVGSASLTGAGAIFSHRMGIFTEFRFNEHLSLRTSLEYGVSGRNYAIVDSFRQDSPGQLSRSYLETTRLHYISTPVAVKYYLLPWFYLKGGASFGLLAAAREDSTTYYFEQHPQYGLLQYGNDTWPGKVREIYKALDVSLVIGAGFLYRRMEVDLNFMPGVMDVRKDERNFKNHYFNVTFGVFFQPWKEIKPIKRKKPKQEDGIELPAKSGIEFELKNRRNR